MSFIRRTLGSAALVLLTASALSAQDQSVRIFGRSGGYNAVTDLNEAGTADFRRAGYNVGGGAVVQVQRYVSLRADFTFARRPFRQNGVTNGVHVFNYFYDGAIQLQYPTEIGLEPYVYAGGGGVTFHQEDTNGPDKTRGAGTAGLGLNYWIPNSNVAVFAEGKGWLYKIDNFPGGTVLSGVNKTQFDVAWTGGVSYRFRY
ncbi:MAG: outer membrane beta-barrel protein [Gemmatimonadetes bacterium]|nr:outer membrane beta-barrel protein [Gemmatimonadota bacterium]